MEHGDLCECVLPSSSTCLPGCLPAILRLFVAFSLSMQDWVPASPSIKLA
jgi:hypothetical protein